jgi:hypothetical protein
VWYEDFAPLGKNLKLTPKWQGLAKITEVNDTDATFQWQTKNTEHYVPQKVFLS